MKSLKPFTEIAPGVVEVREGGGVMSVFGLPFLAAGVFFTLLGIQAVPVQNADEIPWWGWPIVIILGLAATVVGGVLVLGRTRTRLDIGRGTILKQWRLLSHVRSEERRLREFDEVCLRFTEGDSDSVDCYPVVLRAGIGGKDLELYNSADYGEARERAAFLASFLHLPLRDASTEHAELWQPGAVQAVLSEPALPAYRPPVMRSQVEERGDTSVITIPEPGFRASMLLEILIPLGIVAYVFHRLLDFFQRTHTPEQVQYIFLGFLVMIFGVLPSLNFAHRLLRALRGHTRVIASREGMTIETRGALFTRSTKITAKDILGLDFSTSTGSFAAARQEALRQMQQRAPGRSQPPFASGALPAWVERLARLAKSKGVTIKTLAGRFSFAAGLPDDEVCYLHSIVKRSLGPS